MHKLAYKSGYQKQLRRHCKCLKEWMKETKDNFQRPFLRQIVKYRFHKLTWRSLRENLSALCA